MINQDEISDIVNNPAYSLAEMKEKLALLEDEFEDIAEFITVFIGDKRFERKIAKHRGVTRRILDNDK